MSGRNHIPGMIRCWLNLPENNEHWRQRVLRHACSTPLSTLHFAHTLSLQTTNLDDLRRLFDQVHQATTRLEQLIIRHRLHNERATNVNLNQTLRSVANLFDRPDVRIDVISPHTRPLYYRCAQTQFEEVMVCLLSNAVAAYEKNHQKHIMVALKQVADRILVVVSDVGVGMSLNRWQAPISSKPGGGLGLLFARQVVEKNLGGQLLINSMPRVGTRVILNLPRAR